MCLTRRGRVYYPLIVLLLTLALNVSAAAEWPTFHQNFERTGFIESASNYPLNEITILWNYSTGNSIRSSPAVADLDGDKQLEVVFGSDDGILYALNSQGKLVLNYTVGSRIRSPPTIIDFNADNKTEILFGADDGILYALDAKGNTLFTYQTNGPVSTSPAAANFDDSPQLEIIFGSQDGFLYALDYEGSLKWKYETSEAVRSSPAVGDLNGDGNLEIVFGSDDNIVYVLSYPPYKIWQYQTSGDVVASPVISNYDRDGKVEAIYASTDYMVKPIYFSTASGGGGKRKVCEIVGWEEVCTFQTPSFSKLTEDWNYSAGDEVYSSPAVADLNDDGKYEIVFGSEDHGIHIVNSTGYKSGRYSTNKAVKSSPALADLDGESAPEIIFGSDDGKIYVVSYPSTCKYLYPTGGPVRSSPAVADVNNDGSLEFFIGSDDGTLYAFGSNTEFIRAQADHYSALAEESYAAGDKNKTAEHASNAAALHQMLNDSEGVKRDESLVKRFEADDLLDEAVRLYNMSMVYNASDLMAQAALIYSSLNYSRGIDKVRNASSLIDSELFFSEAEELYSMGDFYNASRFALKAEELFLFQGLVEESARSSELSNRSLTRLKADTLFEGAVGDYFDYGFSDNVSARLLEAKGLYRKVNCSSCVHDAELMVERFYGLDWLDRGNVFLRDGDYDSAYECALNASVIFIDLGYEPGFFLAETLENASRDYVLADSLFNQAVIYFSAGSFREAVDYAGRARVIYQSFGDTEKLSEVDLLITDSAAGFSAAEEGSESSARVLHYLIVLPLGVLLIRFLRRLSFRRGKTSLEARQRRYGGHP